MCLLLEMLWIAVPVCHVECIKATLTDRLPVVKMNRTIGRYLALTMKVSFTTQSCLLFFLSMTCLAHLYLLVLAYADNFGLSTTSVVKMRWSSITIWRQQSCKMEVSEWRHPRYLGHQPALR